MAQMVADVALPHNAIEEIRGEATNLSEVILGGVSRADIAAIHLERKWM